MSYTVTGTITSITEVETLSNGAAKLSYRIDTGEQYNNIWEFEIYKGADYVEHAHNFSTYNTVGDMVEVEFNIRPRIWEKEDRVFTTLSHWKCTKVNQESAPDQTPLPEDIKSEEKEDDLPF